MCQEVKPLKGLLIDDSLSSFRWSRAFCLVIDLDTNSKALNIKIEGFLNDKDLHLLYQKCRIALAPLRFGAGVKGKIVEAAYNQIPLITTSIGGEGLDSSIGSFIIENDPNKMANLISDIYINFSTFDNCL